MNHLVGRDPWTLGVVSLLWASTDAFQVQRPGKNGGHGVLTTSKSTPFFSTTSPWARIGPKETHDKLPQTVLLSSSGDSKSNNDDDDQTEPPPQQQPKSDPTPDTSSNNKIQSQDGTTSTKVNGGTAPQPPPPTILQNLGPLTQLTRPANFPGIVLFHMLGIYLALQHVGRLSQYWHVLLADPTMWLVLTALILTSSTSMVVNDYYDFKLGRDTDPDALAPRGGENSRLPLPLVRRYVSYLYGAALVCSTVLPSISTRICVMGALMLTFEYTKHLKPIPWLKNVVCAALIAWSPWTSGSAALYQIQQQTATAATTGFHNLPVWQIPSLWRLVTILFVGFVGREMTMDCNDVQGDAGAGVQTVPVLYGTRFASRIGLAASGIVALLATAVPARDVWRLIQDQTSLVPIWQILKTRVVGRLALAVLGSSMLLRRGWQVFQTEGKNPQVVDRAVGEGLISVLFVLGSFV